MKKKSLFVMMSLAIIVFVIACGSNSNSSKDKEFTVKNSKVFKLDTVNSSIKWNRSVDYKYLKTQVKLFGMMTDVSMENVQFETEGTAFAQSGDLTLINDAMESGKLMIDFSVIRFYSESEEAFFVNETYPPAALTFKKFTQDTTVENSFIADCELTLIDKTKSVSFPIELKKDDKGNIKIVGKYLMKTMEWPIYKNPDNKSVNKDEIMFNFDLFFNLDSEISDTVYSK